MHQLAAQIKQRARDIGFDLVGIASAEPSKYQDYFRHWLDSGRAGSMNWMRDRFDERTNPSVYLPGARSVVCVAMNYHTRLSPSPSPGTPGEGGGEGSFSNAENRSALTQNPYPNSQRVGISLRPTSNLPEYRTTGQERGRVARYALGDDYHDLIKPRLHQLADWIKTQVPDSQTRCAVDTAPVMEKELAARAGIGWLGKNTCIINPEIGSWILLGEIITTLELPPDDRAIDRCGTCRRCIDACPTQAITAPYQLDARKCISYLTIEHRQQIPQELQSQIGEWLYGCDICQDVCPWNKEAPLTNEPAFQPRFPTASLDLGEVLNWRQEDYAARLRGSAMKRVKLRVLQENAKIVLRNMQKDEG